MKIDIKGQGWPDELHDMFSKIEFGWRSIDLLLLHYFKAVY